MTNYILEADASAADVIIMPVLEDKGLETAAKKLDKEFGSALSAVMSAEDFTGKKMQQSLVYTRDAKRPRVLLSGLGSKKELTVRRYKQVLGAAVIAVQSKKSQRIAVVIPETVLSAFGPYRAAKETAAAIEIGGYSYDEYRKPEARVLPLKAVAVTAAFDNRSKTQLIKGLADGALVGQAVNYTRHLGNTPPTVLTPTYLARAAAKLAQENPGLKVKVLSRPEIKKLGMGCLLGVSQGSAQEPKFIVLEYRQGNKKDPPLVLVGKGITFDSGGISLKPAGYLNDMKFDMLGAATVLGVMKALAALKAKKNVVGLIPSCENMPDGAAYRPDDILTAMDGTTVHVSNTDAEGRLILADALCYATRFEPKEVLDFATLTGHCRIALGSDRSGLFSDEENIVQKLTAAAETVGEQLWRLPLGEEYSEAIKSEVADIDNGGPSGRRRVARRGFFAALRQISLGAYRHVLLLLHRQGQAVDPPGGKRVWGGNHG